MAKPLLSIGMIVKNEIRCIERCLKSLQPLREALPCELVIADTGSTDGTRAVVEQYADILFDFEWVNDFSAARNAVMDRCSGKWYFTVDADEYLDEDISDLIQLSHVKEKDWPDVMLVNQRNYNSPDMEHAEYSDFQAVRLARLGQGIRYKGAIHEVFVRRDGRIRKVAYLRHTVLHHDGYALESPEARMAKMDRNLTLLDKELEEHPDDLRRLGQCIEAAGLDPTRQMGYVTQSMEILKGGQGEGCISAPAVASHCALIAALHKLPQAEQWIAWSRTHYPDHVATRIDTAFGEISLNYYKERYEILPELGRQYLEDWERKWRVEFPLVELSNSVLLADGIEYKRKVQVMTAIALAKLGEKEEALALLSDWSFENLHGESVKDWIRGVVQLWDVPQAAEEMARALPALAPMEEDEWREKRWRTVLSLLQQFFQPDWGADEGVEEPWRLLLTAEGFLGQAARIMACDTAEEAEAVLSGVTEWKDFPPPALFSAMELRAKLPASLYRRPSEELSKLAAALGKCGGKLPRVAAEWLTRQPPAATPGELTWQLDVAAAALRAEGWMEDVALGQTLCGLFGDLAQTYLENMYNPELLNADDLPALPGLHRFGWRLVQARKALEEGDELAYVRALRAALEEAPAMKNAVDFLLEHRPQPAPDPELAALAGQVRAILAQYPPDDPAVVQLKASPAYQRVASLLEQQGSHEPAHETKPLDTMAEPSKRGVEEALSGTREEIRDELRRYFRAVGGLGEQRAAYWAKYPLWGATPEEVFDNLSAALTEHREDFLWLYDRLGDGLSRRVFSAVLRNWRFCETGPLQDVIDPCYDDYFDMGLLRCDENEVVADVGAFVGDTFLSYVKNYGGGTWRRYYAYEITSDSFAQLKKVTDPYPRVTCRRKGVGDGPGVMALSGGADASANALAEQGTDTVEIVALDDDISLPLTLIKMDIEGAEQSALRGCACHIQKDRPKLALSVYHNFEDLWKLARMVEDLAPGYRFYLRYHGGNLWPSEITLLGLPE